MASASVLPSAKQATLQLVERLAEITLGDQHSYLLTTSPPDGRDPIRLSTS